MARDFDGATHRIDYTAPQSPVTAQTFGMWVYPHTFTTPARYFFNIHQSGDSGLGCFLAALTGPPFELVFQVVAGLFPELYKAATVSISTNQWSHLVYTWDGTLNHSGINLYINGNLQTTSLRSANGSGTPNLAGSWSLMGRKSDNARNVDGLAAEPAWWNRVLSAAEIAALAKGFSPAHFPQGLKFYPNLIRDINDSWSGQAGTNVNTTVAAHIPIIYPSQSLWTPGAAGEPPEPPTFNPSWARGSNQIIGAGYVY